MSDVPNETHETPAPTNPPPSTANGTATAPAAEPSTAPPAGAKPEAVARPQNGGSADGKNRSTRHNVAPSTPKPPEKSSEAPATLEQGTGHVVHATPSESGAEIKTHAEAVAALAELAAVAEAVAPSTALPTGLRLRVKVWTEPGTGKRYLMPTAVLSDPASGIMTAYAMSDTDTKVVKLTPPEWNALPFFYFQEDGPAPRASARPPDAVR